MQPTVLLLLAAASSVAALLAKDVVTDNVLQLEARVNHNMIGSPSSMELARHRNKILARRRLKSRQNYPNSNVNENLIGIGGRVYITNVTIASQNFALVIDTGSSDTWVAASDFQCKNPNDGSSIDNAYCNFPSYYNRAGSPTWRSINYNFSVQYSGGEYLQGPMGTDYVGIGGISQGRNPYVTVNQTIGAVNQGYWNGDGVSSGLMGLAYPALASGINSGQLNYTSMLYTLFKNPSIPPVFSLALRRATTAQPSAGGLLAIGGVPSNVATDGRWVQVPIQAYPNTGNTIFAFYSINIDGFDITPPSSTTTTTTPTSTTRPATASPTGSYASSPQNMIIDSGTSLLYFPDQVAQYIASLFSPPARYNSNTNTYIVSCTARAPRVGVRIGGQSYFISEDDLMNRGPGAVGGAYVGANPGECAVAVQNSMGGTLVLGDSWLKNVLVVFDLANATDIGPRGSDKDKNGGGAVRIAGREVYT